MNKIAIAAITAATIFASINTASAVDLYFPLTAKHTENNLKNGKQYNETNIGIGIGAEHESFRSFAVGFKDSFNNPSYMAGISKETEAGFGDFRVGVGVSGFLMSRKMKDGSKLFPGALPYLTTSYKGVTVITTYIPKITKNGSPAYFFMLRVGM